MNPKRPRGRPRTRPVKVRALRIPQALLEMPEQGVAQGEILRLLSIQRVFAVTDEEARAAGGEDAVAVLDARVILPRELWRRAKNAAAAMRESGLPIDASRILEINLARTVAALEAQYNDGEPFDDPLQEAPRCPIPRAKIKD